MIYVRKEIPLATQKKKYKVEPIISKDDVQEMKDLANAFAGTLHHDSERSSFLRYSDCVIKNMKKISKHIDKMNNGWNGNE